MIIFIVLIVLVVVGIVLVVTDTCFEWGVFIIRFFLALFFAAMLMRLIMPLSVHSEIRRFEATKATIEQARENGIDLEDAAMQQNIIESNQWLAGRQYNNSTIFGYWIPDEVDDLEPIQ